MATILKGVGFTPQFISDTYEAMNRPIFGAAPAAAYLELLFGG